MCNCVVWWLNPLPDDIPDMAVIVQVATAQLSNTVADDIEA